MLKMLLTAYPSYFEEQRELQLRLIDQMVTYCLLERDGRSLIGTQGWACAQTRLIDVALGISRLKGIVRADKIFLLSAVMVSLGTMNEAFSAGEVQHFSRYALYLLPQHNLYDEVIQRFVERWQQEWYQIETRSEGDWKQLTNRNRLQQGLLLHAPDLSQELREMLNQSKDFPA